MECITFTLSSINVSVLSELTSLYILSHLMVAVEISLKLCHQ